MTERQIECFLCLAKTLSFNKAAKELYLTQPAVTQQIHALENDLGVSLFCRSHKGVTLTASGLIFHEDAIAFLNHSRQIVNHVRRTAERYKTLCEICYMLPLNSMPAIISKYHELHPDSFVHIKQGDPVMTHLQEFLDACDVAVAFGDTRKDYGAHRFIALYEGSIVAIMSARHRLADRKRISIGDLEGEMIFSLSEYLRTPFIHEFHAFLIENYGVTNITSSANAWEASAMAEAG
ncbi:MAG: LysR family transcriptional regulator, partial [Sphaerochaetaceae bacterium]